MAILARCNLVVQDDAGNILNNASVRVEKEEAGFPPASLFSDRAGATPILNPFTATNGADAGFHVIGGRYRITATLGPLVRTWRYVGVGTAQEFDADLVKAGGLLIWDTGTADANPGAGRARGNNASLAVGNTLFISKTNRGGSAIANFLLQLDDSTNTDKGGLILSNPLSDTQAFVRVTGIVDAVNYVKVTYNGHSGETGFANDTPINLFFSRSGDAVTTAASITYNGSNVQAALDQRPGRNHLKNGQFNVTQRGTSFTSSGGGNNDNVYTFDRWKLLSPVNNTVNVTQETADVPANGLNAAKLTVVTVNNKFGLLQFCEQKDSIGLIGQQVVASFKAKVNNTTRLDKIKAAIISWTGTADNISAIISSWSGDGTNPALVASATYENSPVDLNVTTSWASYFVTGLVDTASTKNVGVLIWSDNSTDTDAGDFLSIADVQLEVGVIPSLFDRVSAAEDYDAARRYFQRIAAGNLVYIANAFCKNTTDFSALFRFDKPFRTTPLMTLSSQAHFQLLGVGGGLTATTVLSLTTADIFTARLDGSVASGLTGGHGVILVSGNAAALMDFSAEFF